MPDETESLPLDFFLGPQRITHAIASSSLLGIDGVLYSFGRNAEPCPERNSGHHYPSNYDYATGRYVNYLHWRDCTRATLGTIRPYTADELETLSLIVDINAKRFRVERVVTFYRHAKLDLIYALDESWSDSAGKTIVQIGTVEINQHDHYWFQVDPDGLDDVPSHE